MKQTNENEALLLSLASFVVQVVGVVAFFSLFFRLVTAREAQDLSQQRRSLTSQRKARGRRERRRDTKPRIPPSDTSLPTHHSRLPQELVDEIIDHLRLDKLSLKACALTSRRWLPRCRTYLYSTLIIRHGGNDPYKLNFYPEVLSRIKHVILRGSLGSEIKHSPLNGRVDVQILEVEGIQEPFPNPYTILTAELPRFPGLQTLCLRNAVFPTSEQMFAMLLRLKLLSALMIDLSDHQYAFVNPLQSNDAPKLALKKLHLRLRSMIVPLGHTPRSHLILRAAGTALRRLSVEVMSFGQYSSFAVIETLDLSSNTSLEILEVSLVWTRSKSSMAERRNRERPATALLSLIHSQSFHTLVFRISILDNTDEPFSVRDLDLQMIDFFAQPVVDASMVSATADRVLACAANLRNVTIKLSFGRTAPAVSSIEPSRVESFVKEQLPMLTARGILRVGQCESAHDATVDIFLGSRV